MSAFLKSWRFAIGYLAFVIAGSLLLLAWLRSREREESTRIFHALARADAEFVRRSNLPRSQKLADDLAKLLGMHIQFVEAGKAAASNQDTLVIPLDEKHDMIFTRPPTVSRLSVGDPATRNALLTFWAVAAIVGGLLARERSKRAQTARLAMLGRVATSLAHDIKNPLASIQLHAQLMQPGNKEDAEAVKLIQSEAEVISGLVNQWLHLANPTPPKLSCFDLGGIIRHLATSLDAQARHAGVTIEVSLPAPLEIQGDVQRLSQAFRNLIVNAIQAMPLGGYLRITHEKMDREVLLRFTDSGTGFSESALARGTELFYSEKEGGMGVGLNIAAGIIQAHGGDLTLQNGRPGGAIVSIKLPSTS